MHVRGCVRSFGEVGGDTGLAVLQEHRRFVLEDRRYTESRVDEPAFVDGDVLKTRDNRGQSNSIVDCPLRALLIQQCAACLTGAGRMG